VAASKPPKVRVQVASERTHSVSLGASELIDLLRAKGVDVPASAEVVFQVPGGADWSGSEVEVASTEEANHDAVVTVRWRDRVEEESRR
jgi:hypothetical protein